MENDGKWQPPRHSAGVGRAHFYGKPTIHPSSHQPITSELPTIQESVRSANATGLLRFADILVQLPAP
jgi:hypothetical protein